MRCPIGRGLPLLLACLCLTIQSGAIGAPQADTAREICLPSALPSGDPVVDRIWVRFLPASNPRVWPAPGVVIIHEIGGYERDPLMVRLANYLAQRGINCAVLALPYHGRRRLAGAASVTRFAGGRVTDFVQSYAQSSSDVSTVATWLMDQPGVDRNRIGVVGVSLGAIIAHLAMGQDERLRTGVAIQGGGDLPDLHRSSLVARLEEGGKRRCFTEREIALLRTVDPLTYANRNRPRHVLMIEAARDLLIAPHDAEELWRALGKPPIQWLDTNHFGLTLTPVSAFKAAAVYLEAMWYPREGQEIKIPEVYAPTIKLGFVLGDNHDLTGALTWQFHSFSSRPDHLSRFHADFGLTARGPFAGLAATITPFVDLGVATRIRRVSLLPYVSMHLVF